MGKICRYIIQGGIQMLGKLIKYDLKYGVRIFIILHVILIAVCTLGRFFYMEKISFNAPANTIIPSLIVFCSVLILLFTAVCFGMTALIAVRFYKNLFTDEGYLTWTLPATATQHLWAKIISGVIWETGNLLLCSLGLWILVSGDNVTTAYAAISSEVTVSLGMTISQFGMTGLLYGILGTIGSVIFIYLCIGVGQLFPGHRVLCSIVMYVILSAVTQMITFALMFAFHIAPGSTNYVLMTGTSATYYMMTSFRISAIMSVLLIIVGYIGIHYIMNKKVNLN